jgi:valyl-tRNA synthetase
MDLSKTYEPQKIEEKILKFWEKGGFFKGKIVKGKKPFTILLPLPNANDPIHLGHALFTVEDIMIRYHRMLGEPTLWLPGGDHAGIETQYVFEKNLAKEGKSRFDFDRETLYRMISDFVEKNKNINRDQMKRLGFSFDWSRYHYSLEPKIVEFVLETFRQLHRDGLVYRAERLVNYCPKCGTAFSDLEVDHVEKEDFLYYLDYGPISIATTRPETMFADVAVAVNPKDKRYAKLIGQKAIIPLINKPVPIISDEAIDAEFGTGALKVTPAHDQTDFQIGQRHHLDIIKCLDRNGRLINVPEKYLGLTINRARGATVDDLKNQKKLIKTEPLKHTVGICYRCKTTIEPFLMPQWWVKMKPLAKPAIEAVKRGKTRIFPEKRFKKMYFDWLENIIDWNISRQIVWGPRIPAWYCLDCHPKIFITFIGKNGQKISGCYQDLKQNYSFEEINKGLQSLTAPIETEYSLDDKPCRKCTGKNIVRETDTFDTWFLSGQWPLTTLGFPKSKDFKYFYPTSVLDTLWDILFFWVARMIMLGIYRSGKVPFRVVHLHCRVVDKHGQKMSKSKGNVIDPLPMVEKYGADALRMSLVFGTSPGSDIPVDENKIRGMRNFANKIWNASRFVFSYQGQPQTTKNVRPNKQDQQILKELKRVVDKTDKYLTNYRFDLAADLLYHFFWHKFCDKYIESAKDRREQAQPILLHVLSVSLKLLHPFMPFITEEIWQQLPIKKKKKSLASEAWPN